MIMPWLFLLFIFIFAFCEGVKEGFKWAKLSWLTKNKLVHPNGGNNGFMDYHAWQVCSRFAIVGMLFTFDGDPLTLLLAAISSWSLFHGVVLYLNFEDSSYCKRAHGKTWFILNQRILYPSRSFELFLSWIALLSFGVFQLMKYQ